MSNRKLFYNLIEDNKNRLIEAVKACIVDVNLDTNSKDVQNLKNASIVRDHPCCVSPNDYYKHYKYIITLKGFVYISSILKEKDYDKRIIKEN